MSERKKTPPQNPKKHRKIRLSLGLDEHVYEMVRVGAEYYNVDMRVYTQWLLEQALKDEIDYYGWTMFKPRARKPRKVTVKPSEKAVKAVKLGSLLTVMKRHAKLGDAVKVGRDIYAQRDDNEQDPGT